MTKCQRFFYQIASQQGEKHTSIVKDPLRDDNTLTDNFRIMLEDETEVMLEKYRIY